MAIVTRASTFSIFSNTLGNVNNTQSRLFTLQDQISSGLKTSEFAGLTGQVEQFTSLEEKIKEAVRFQENNALNISRLQTTRVAVEQIIEIADDMEDLLTLRRNGALEDNISFEQQMRGKIRALSGELNATFGGLFIFGGTKSNVNPVIIEPDVPAPIENGVPDDNYYQGSKTNIQIRADENIDLDVFIRADNIAFQRMFASAFQSIEAHIVDDEESIASALDQLQVGLEETIAIQANIDADILALEDISERQNSLQLYWQGVAETVSRTDVVEASTKLAQDQAILQASFQAFATINALRLVDFLR